MTYTSPVTVETVRGAPIKACGRTLTPVARVVSVVRHQGTIRETRIEGAGWGVAFVKPLAIMEERDGEVRSLLIRDVTSVVLRQMAIVAAVVAVVAVVLINVNRLVQSR